MSGKNASGPVFKILGGCLLLVYWMYILYELSNTHAFLIGEKTALVHIVGFLMIIIGWVFEDSENNISETEIADIRKTVESNVQILEIIGDALGRDKKSS